MHCVGTVQTFSFKHGDACRLIAGTLKGLKYPLTISNKNLLILALYCKPMRYQDTIDILENG
jgi:hypothetical protein